MLGDVSIKEYVTKFMLRPRHTSIVKFNVMADIFLGFVVVANAVASLTINCPYMIPDAIPQSDVVSSSVPRSW
jgi:hypothetical protein